MGRLKRFCDVVVDVGIAGLLLVTPFAFGPVETWAVVLLESVCFTIALAWCVGRLASGSPRAATGLEVPIVLFVLVVSLQLLPLPRGALAWLSPRACALYERTAPGFARSEP